MPYTHIESIAKILETNELQELREHLLQLPDKDKNSNSATTSSRPSGSLPNA